MRKAAIPNRKLSYTSPTSVRERVCGWGIKSFLAIVVRKRSVFIPVRIYSGLVHMGMDGRGNVLWLCKYVYQVSLFNILPSK